MPKKKETKTTSNYEAKDIYVLEGLDPVRKRPGMYIGSTGVDGLHHLIWEVADNSIDEAMADYATEVEIALLGENKVRVADNGRGIPVDIHKQTKKSALETVMTTLHAGGKFGGESYKVAGGLHGVGVSVVNALSIWMMAQVHRNGYIHFQEYRRGKAKFKVKKNGTTKLTGTVVAFEPDDEIFGGKDKKIPNFDIGRILSHLREQAYLTKGIKIRVLDLRDLAPKKFLESKNLFINNKGDLFDKAYTFHFEGGIISYIKFLNQGAEEPIHPEIFYVNKEHEGLLVETAFQFTDEIQSEEVSFANNIKTGEGGMHLTGFRTALTRSLNDYARKNGFLKEADDNLSGDDVREGITAVISIKLKEPQFEGQTKAKLGNPEARTAVELVIGEALPDWLESHPAEARKILEKVILAQKARKAAKAARDTVLRKGALEGFTLPGKLADCSSTNPSECELFIVEGDSAGGSAKQGRNRRSQAILPLRGKILNVERARLDKMLASQEIRALVIALGTAIADEFDLEKLRYHRIIIMTDADVDGAHIRTLLLTLFYRYFPSLIESGHLYIAQAPLYRVSRGREIKYAFSEEEKEKVVKEWQKKSGASAKGGSASGGRKQKSKVKKEEVEEGEEEDEGEKKVSGLNIQRYKGLGEMNPEQLWETTMNPENRILKQVTVNDGVEADKTFDVLMGSEVAPRRKFIQTHAKAVKNLDI
jgi:DNA gyrase subunit B